MGLFVKDLRVTSLDADRAPSKSDLTVALAAGTILNSPGGVDTQFRLNTPLRVAASDIPSLIEEAKQVGKNLHEGVVPPSVAPEPRTWRPWIIAGNALLILAVVGYLLWRRNR
jgi:hypothetical protein